MFNARAGGEGKEKNCKRSEVIKKKTSCREGVEEDCIGVRSRARGYRAQNNMQSGEWEEVAMDTGSDGEVGIILVEARVARGD